MVTISRVKSEVGSPVDAFEVVYVPPGLSRASMLLNFKSKASLLDFLVRIHNVEPQRAAAALEEVERNGSARIE